MRFQILDPAGTVLYNFEFWVPLKVVAEPQLQILTYFQLLLDCTFSKSNDG